MKWIFPLLFVLLFAAMPSHAQFTLTLSSFPSSVIGTDSVLVTDSASAFPSLTHAAPGMWDMSTVTDSPGLRYVYYVPATPYQYADSGFFNFGSYGYQASVEYNILSTGMYEYGSAIQKAAYRLPNPPFANPMDSIKIDTQHITYSSPRTVISFPATYGTTWSSVYQYDFFFHMTAIEMGLINAPCVYRTFVVEKDTVVGWGQMRVKDASGYPSPYFNVLQVQSTTISTDSFFISGAVPSTAVLAVLGITEGGKDTSYEQNYYRTMEVTPLAVVDFNDAAYTDPYTATTHARHLGTTHLPNIIDKSGISVFPNPVNNREVSITLPPVPGEWSYRLTDMNGTTVQENVLHSGTTDAHITLAPALPVGIYFIKLNNNGSLFAVKPIDVMK